MKTKAQGANCRELPGNPMTRDANCGDLVGNTGNDANRADLRGHPTALMVIFLETQSHMAHFGEILGNPVPSREHPIPRR